MSSVIILNTSKPAPPTLAFHPLKNASRRISIKFGGTDLVEHVVNSPFKKSFLQARRDSYHSIKYKSSYYSAWAVKSQLNDVQSEILQDSKPSSSSSQDFRSGLPPEGLILFLSCIIGLLVGSGVVCFNLSIHEIHDFFWNGVPETGATWFRNQSLEDTWPYLLFIPVTGGLCVGLLNTIRTALEESLASDKAQSKRGFQYGLKSVLIPIFKAVSAAITLGTGNSLGPEGPSVEIGASVATGVSRVLRNSKERRLAMVAAGSAAGISSGFNAAVSGCFFAVENVLRSSASSAGSLPTAMILLSSVLASVVSQAGLGSSPALKVVSYDFKSPAELPLYLLLGLFCGLVSIGLTKGSAVASQGFERLRTVGGIHPFFLPSFGGLTVGVLALAYPEILYWGWINVNDLLAPGPSPFELPAILLLQLAGAKIFATAICRGSGLVGGVYAPSLFIGASLGAAYGQLVDQMLVLVGPTYHVDWIQVAAPQAYAMVGMAATLAGVCQVPLTSVLLLFELTRDYRIILPLMAAVGLSSWIASTANKKPKKISEGSSNPPSLNGSLTNSVSTQSSLNGSISRPKTFNEEVLSGNQVGLNLGFTNGSILASNPSFLEDSAISGIPKKEELCLLEDSLCVADDLVDEDSLLPEISVASAMRTYFARVEEWAYLREAMAEMQRKREWCVVVLGRGGTLRGILTLADIQEEASKLRNGSYGQNLDLKKLTVGALLRRREGALVVVPADASLAQAQRLMNPRGLRQLPVVAANGEGQLGIDSGSYVVGLLDREAISVACRAEATRRTLLTLSYESKFSPLNQNKPGQNGATRSQNK